MRQDVAASHTAVDAPTPRNGTHRLASHGAAPTLIISHAYPLTGSHSHDALEIMLEPSVSSEEKASEMRLRLRKGTTRYI